MHAGTIMQEKLHMKWGSKEEASKRRDCAVFLELRFLKEAKNRYAIYCDKLKG